jgi:hypothetical protein
MNNEPVFWSPGVSLATIEKQVILKAYRWFRGNATQTAIALGVSEKTIRNKLAEYEADDKKRLEAQTREREERHNQLIRSRGLVGLNIEGNEGVTIGTGAGFRMEPANEAAPKHGVSVSESAEVQSVLPSKAAAGRDTRRG